MATRVILIEASPTPWDVEGRITGSVSLPLTAEAIDALRHLLATIPGPVAGVYRPGENEACEQAARLIAQKFALRARDNPDLQAVHMGLWQGLTPEEVRARFPTVFPQWQERPLAVTPPDGEPLAMAIERISEAVRRILKRNRDQTVALALRPMAMQIALGWLRGEAPQIIAGHLHERQAMATIDVGPEERKVSAA